MRFYYLLLPIKLDWFPVYKSQIPLHRGQRVEVTFSSKTYLAVVLGEAPAEEIASTVKVLELENIPDNIADISEKELKLWTFVSEYYLCSLGEVYEAAYPKYKRTLAKRKKKALQPSTVISEEKRAESGKPILYFSSDRVPYYLSKLNACIKQGFSALVLLSERELASIMEEKLSSELDAPVLLYDSSLSPAARKKITESLGKAEEPLVLLGTRSAIFLPFRNLGLVIVDEEQDPYFKQTEPAPRYNGRDMAAVLSSIYGAQLILGSFAPSLESLYNCSIGKYDFLEGEVALNCKLEVVDINAEKKKKGMEGEYSKRLLSEISRTKGQLMIIRSYSSEESVYEFFRERFPDLDPQILTAQAARKATGHCALMAILNGDSLFDSEDFRSDEKAFQLLRNLSLRCDKLFIQCSSSAHPVFSSLKKLDYEYRLLEERKVFKLPPYTRIVDIKDRKSGELVLREVFERDSKASEQKSKLPLRYGAMYIIDVDPQ